MNKPDWFPLYVQRFLSSADVLQMSHTGGFAYVLLLCHAWHQEPAGSLPDDDGTLAVWARLRPVQWARVRAEVLRPFKKGDDGRWHQEVMAGIAAKAHSMIEQRRQAGIASAAHRKGNARSTFVQRPLNERSTAHVVVAVDLDPSSQSAATATTPVERSLNGRSIPTLTAPQAEMYRQIIVPPQGIADGDWVDRVVARDLACLPTTTPALIAHVRRGARAKGINRPAAYVVSKLRSPDSGLLEALAAQEAQ